MLKLLETKLSPKMDSTTPMITPVISQLLPTASVPISEPQLINGVLESKHIWWVLSQVLTLWVLMQCALVLLKQRWMISLGLLMSDIFGFPIIQWSFKLPMEVWSPMRTQHICIVTLVSFIIQSHKFGAQNQLQLLAECFSEF